MPLKLAVFSIAVTIAIVLLFTPSGDVAAGNTLVPSTNSLNKDIFHGDNHQHDDDDDDQHSSDQDGDQENDSGGSEEGDAGGDEVPDDNDDGNEESPPEPIQRPTPLPGEDDDDEDAEHLPSPHLDLTHSCTTEGTTFTIINHGGDMQTVESYTLRNGASGEYQLNWKESHTITSGFGSVTIDAGSVGSLTVDCQRPPELTISGVCWPNTGVIFTIRNSGGPMTERQAYTVSNTTNGSFWLGAGEYIEIEVGFGDPVFFSEGLNASMGSMCRPAGSLAGVIWSDTDGNGIHDLDERGLANIEVSLVSNGDPITLKTATDGMYLFEVVPDSYQIFVTPSQEIERYLQLTADPDGELDGTTLVNLNEAAPDFTGNFGYQPTRSSSITGLVWLETHDFGQRDPDEVGLDGVNVELLDAEGGLLQTFVVAADGRYEFLNLEPGEYTIQVDAASLPTQMFATYDLDLAPNFKTTVSLRPGETLQGVEFGIVGTF